MNPELAAQTILQHFWHRHLPVRPIDIAAKLGINVFETDDQNLIGYDREAKRIVIDKSLAQNLRRFNIAYHMGRRLEWDGVNERFTNCEKANELLHYKYRDGYGLG